MTKRRQLLFSFNCVLATVLALLISFNIGLPRPYWAMATVYIVSQPVSGALRSKGIYRAIGTVIGAAAAIALVPTLSSWPELVVLGLASWVALCLYTSLLDRTPRSYVFLLAGYTAAIIGFPTAAAPLNIFDVAIARLEEILLGIVCATVVHSLIGPRTLTPILKSRLAVVIRDAEAWTLDALRGVADSARLRDRYQLAVEITDIRVVSTTLPFDLSAPGRTSLILSELQDRLILLLPLVTAIEDRVRALAQLGDMPPPVARAVAAIARWIECDDTRLLEEARSIHATLDEAAAERHASAAWSTLLIDNLFDRMHRLVNMVHDGRALYSAFVAGAFQLPPLMEERSNRRNASLYHLDKGLAGLSALAAFLAILTCGALWLGLSWPEGSVAALTAAVFCSFFATRDDPAPSILGFLYFTLVSIPIVGLYLFAIIPMIDGFPMLVLVLTPTMLLIGYLIPDPRFSGPALATALGISNGLALQETFSADYASFVNGNMAQIIGLGAALLLTRLVRSVGAEWTARRILRSGWREVAAMADTRLTTDRGAFMTLMIDRLGLLVPRLALTKPDPELDRADIMNDMRIGFNLDDLKRAQTRFSATTQQLISGILTRLSDHFQTLSHGRSSILTKTTQIELDQALNAAATEADRDDAVGWQGVLALVGLRRSLFSDQSGDPAAAGA